MTRTKVAETLEAFEDVEETPRKNIFQRLLDMQKMLPYIVKDTDVGFRGVSYRGISHDAVVKAVRKVAIASDVAIVQSVTKWDDLGNRMNVEVATTFVCTDEPEDKFTVLTVGQGMDSQDKGAGKAMSYAKKYGLILPLMLETRDGDELRPEEDFKMDLEYLQVLLRKQGKSVKAMCDHLGIDALEDITEEQYFEMVKLLA